jgi:prepilin-type processing-associated H-X9-DG protein
MNPKGNTGLDASIAYGINFKSTMVQNPSAFVFMGDGRARSTDLPYYGTPTKEVGVQHCWVKQFSARHNVGGNLTFADGHVAYFKYTYVCAGHGCSRHQLGLQRRQNPIANMRAHAGKLPSSDGDT